jgi:hypothetical protein
MPVSPQDYALWAQATGNPYPKTPEEKARLAPEVYDFNRGFGKFKGFDEVQGFQGDTVYDQPISIRNFGENTLLQSPITPDNNVPKVAGQLNNTLTGMHYSQHHADDAYETGFGGTERPRSLLEKAALGALGVGAAAAGLYGAQKLTGRDLGVGQIGGMVRNLGQRAKSGIKSALGLAKEAADPSFVTREGAENVLAVAQHGTSAIDDVAPGLVRGQNVVPAEIRVSQTLKSRIPDPWSESALGSGGQTMSAPAQQSVIASQTSGAGIDPDIQSRVSQFTQKIGYSSPALETASMQQMRQQMSPGSVLDPMTGQITEAANASFFTNPERNIRQMPGEKFAEGTDPLRGLLGAQRPLPEGSLSGVQRRFSTDPRAATVQKQAEAIFQATGDPGVIRSAYGEAPGLPIRVTLPSGETVPTGNLYEAFAPVVNPKTGVPVTEARAEKLQGALNMQGKIKARALEQLGVPSTYQPSQAELQSLDPRTKKLLGETADAVKVAQASLAQAEANPLLYKLRPEVTEGIREVPVISQTTREVVGSRVVPEVQGIPTSEYYQMRAAGGAGRQEVGGVGRRREALASEGFMGPSGSAIDTTPYLYRNIETGDVLTEGQFQQSGLPARAVVPMRGTAVEPQRIMGQEGRTFKGVSADVIDPRSFDPGALAQLAATTPEVIDPSTGLAYSQQAMGGQRAAQQRRQIETVRQSGRRVPSRITPGATIPASVRMGGAISESGAPPEMGTRFSTWQPAAPGSERAQQAELLRQRAELQRQILSGELTLPSTPSTEVVPVPISYPQGTKRGTASPVQRAISRYARFVGNPNEL